MYPLCHAEEYVFITIVTLTPMIILILVKLQSQEETNVCIERDKITLHTLESVHNYP